MCVKIPIHLKFRVLLNIMDDASIEFIILTNADELKNYSAQWDSLAKSATQQTPLLSFSWFSAYLKYCFLPGQEWFCALAISNSVPVAILVLELKDKTIFGVRHIVAQTPFNDHHNIGDLLTAPGLPDKVLSDLIEFVLNRYPKVRYIELSRVATHSPTIGALSTGSIEPNVSIWSNMYGAYLPIPNNFDEFRKSLGRNFRSNLNKAGNKLTKLDEYSYEFISNPDCTQDYFTRFVEIERSGWKGLAGSAIGESERWMNFYKSIVEGLGKSGMLEWHFLRTGDTDLAGHMAFRLSTKLVLWKLAYNEAYEKYSPGSLLLEELIRWESKAHTIKEIDLTTDEKWYRNWLMKNRRYYRVRIYQNSNIFCKLLYVIDSVVIGLRNNPLLKRIWRSVQSIKSRLNWNFRSNN